MRMTAAERLDRAMRKSGDRYGVGVHTMDADPRYRKLFTPLIENNPFGVYGAAYRSLKQRPVVTRESMLKVKGNDRAQMIEDARHEAWFAVAEALGAIMMSRTPAQPRIRELKAAIRQAGRDKDPDF